MFVLLIWLWSMGLTAQSLTIPELNALQDFARALGISNWDLSTQPDPCNWDGISCNSNRSSIAEIRLSGRGYEGFIPSSICNLSALTNLQLYKNNLRGNIPACIGQLKSLQKLGLGTNLLCGSIPAEIGSMSSLLSLHLDNNNFTGSIPSSIANLSRLQDLLLATNSLTGTIPAELGRLKHLTKLWLHANKLSGEVPQSFAKLRSMSDLTLSYNLFTGNISFIQGMPLRRLWLNGNSFNGQIPNVSLANLYECDLGFNQFNGTIPEVLAVSSLQSLLLGHNHLEGSLPLAFGNLPTLFRLDLSHNSLTGSTRHLASIKEKDFSFNYFEDQNGFLDLNCNASFGRQDPCFPSILGSEGGFGINAGGEEIIVNGMTFKEDRAEISMGLHQIGDSSWLLELSGFKDKSISERGLITADFQNGIYGSARWSPSYLAYHGTKLTNGDYKITLYFTEMLPVRVGQRVFDVIVQGKLVLQDLDLRAQVGTSPFQFMVTASVTNGTLSIELEGKHYNFWYPQGSGPIISAISVSPLFQISEGTISLNGVKIGFSLILFMSLAMAVYMLVVCHRSSDSFHVKLATESGMELLTDDQKTVDKISGIGPTIFTYQEMWKATNGFDQEMMLGKGGFGAVYKGILPDGTVVAVKQLSQISRKNGQNFKNEIAILSMLQHRNLLGIKGYCLESKAYLLVCDYMENGSLEKALFHGPGLDWATRRKVAIGTACGLQYLHEESKYHVIHCDVKPANILLDKDMNACVADFGLATFLKERISQTVESRVGTFGYMAPEYIYWNELSEKVDVYSFGVVLLELLSGKHPTWPTAKSHNVNDSSKSFVRQAQELAYAQPCKLLDLIDERLDGLFDPQEAIDMSNVALLCTQESANARPRMRDVWLMLSQTIEIPTVTNPKATARRS